MLILLCSCFLCRPLFSLLVMLSPLLLLYSRLSFHLFFIFYCDFLFVLPLFFLFIYCPFCSSFSLLLILSFSFCSFTPFLSTFLSTFHQLKTRLKWYSSIFFRTTISLSLSLSHFNQLFQSSIDLTSSSSFVSPILSPQSLYLPSTATLYYFFSCVYQTWALVIFFPGISAPPTFIWSIFSIFTIFFYPRPKLNFQTHVL